jgi:hypothetical protein
MIVFGSFSHDTNSTITANPAQADKKDILFMEMILIETDLLSENTTLIRD